MLLKASIVISKWVDSEADLRRMKTRSKSKNIEKIEQQLDTLYFDSLTLISFIYKSGKTKGSRSGIIPVNPHPLLNSSLRRPSGEPNIEACRMGPSIPKTE